MTSQAIIADDLTGAMDTGVQALRKGRDVRVVLDFANCSPTGPNGGLTVIHTGSRNLPPQEAYKRVCQALHGLKQDQSRVIYKKIDSTLRGNIGAELNAVLDSGAADAVLIAPALPFNGRTTIGGHHFVNKIAIERTELAHDPFSPVKHSFLPTIVSLQSRRKTGVIHIETVKRGACAVKEAIEDQWAVGTRIFVGDAQTDEDLASLAGGASSASFEGSVLLCGSAGLFEQMRLEVRACEGATKRRAWVCKPMNNKTSRYGALCVCGSPSSATARQVQATQVHSKASHVKADQTALWGSCQRRADEIKRLAIEVSTQIAVGKNVVLDVTDLGKRDLFNRHKDDVGLLHDRSVALLDAASAVSLRVLASTPIGGLAFLGGDTAAAVSKAIGTAAVDIGGEVERYVPFGWCNGGMAHGKLMVTKAGGFGDDSTLLRILEFVEARQ